MSEIQHIIRWAPQDWRTSSVRMRSVMTGDQVLRTVYLEALFAIYEQGGEIPADPDTLQDVLAIPSGEIERVLPVLLEIGSKHSRGGLQKVKKDDGTEVLVNRRASEDLAGERAYRQGQRDMGRRGGRPAFKSNGHDNHPVGLPIGQPISSEGYPNPTLSDPNASLMIAEATPSPPTPYPTPLPTPTPTPSPKKRTSKSVSGGPATERDTAEREGAEAWAVKPVRPKGVTPRLLEAVVVRCLREIRQDEVSPARCSSAAQSVLGLWRANGSPADVDLFADELVLVARAAQMCGDRLFARDIRAEGWQDGQDRTFQLETICRRGVWDDRLRVAKAWGVSTGRVREDGITRAYRRRWLDPSARSSWEPVSARVLVYPAQVDPDSPSELWPRVAERLELQIDADAFATWFRPLKARDDGPQRLVLLAPNERFRLTLEESFRADVDRAALTVEGPPIEVRIEIASGADPVERATDEPVPLFALYLDCARELFGAELAGEDLRMALERLGTEMAGRRGLSVDLTALVRLALDEVGKW